MLADILLACLEFLFQCVTEYVLYVTGALLILVLSFGMLRCDEIGRHESWRSAWREYGILGIRRGDGIVYLAAAYGTGIGLTVWAVGICSLIRAFG